jgi:hypothetical protein
MAFTELLSSSFLFSIAIIIILIGLIFLYISYRMSEQDHKISSMLGLITTMAEEMQFFRSKLSRLSGLEHHPIVLDPNNLMNMVAGNSNRTDLISVSDDDCNEEYDDEECSEDDNLEENSEDDESEDNSSEDDLDEASEEEEEDDDLQKDIKILNISSLGNDEIDIEPLEAHRDDLNIKSIHLEEPIDIVQHKIIPENISSDLKTISIVDLEEINKKPTDYKRMSLNKLREVVIEKGMVLDASKLKKNEILKLLGVETI